jgi:hypothetical protein
MADFTRWAEIQAGACEADRLAGNIDPAPAPVNQNAGRPRAIRPGNFIPVSGRAGPTSGEFLLEAATFTSNTGRPEQPAEEFPMSALSAGFKFVLSVRPVWIHRAVGN